MKRERPMARAGLPSPHRRNFLTLLATPAALAACGADALLDVRIDSEWFRSNFEEAHAARWLAAAPTGNGFFRTAFTRSWQPKPRQPGDLVGQARMIYVMAAGYDVSGNPAYLAQVKMGADFLLERFADPMHGGWVEAVTPEGKFANENKRLYSQAFALFGLAHAYRVSRDPRYVQSALAGWGAVREKFADDAGGFRAGMNREMTQTKLDNTQNPIMHLFEALLALHDTGMAPDALEGARRIAKLVVYRLMQGHKDGGALIPEFYDAGWKPLPEDKGGLIEIGHQFEWAYLLSAGVERGLEPIYAEVAGRLLKFAIDSGHDKADGGVFTSMSPAGKMMRAKGYWQQAEALRALMHHGKLRGRGDLRGMVTAMTEYIQEEFLDRDNGGWYPQSRSECQRVGCPDSQPDAYHMAALHMEAMRLAKLAKA